MELAIAEEKAKAAKSQESSESVGDITKDAARVSEKSAGPAEEGSDRVRELEKEVIDLKITNRGKDYFIDQLKRERESFAQERETHVDQLMTLSRKVGQLETSLRQISDAAGELPRVGDGATAS